MCSPLARGGAKLELGTGKLFSKLLTGAPPPLIETAPNTNQHTILFPLSFVVNLAFEHRI